MTSEEYLIAEERAHNIWMLKFRADLAELRETLVETYSEDGVKKVEKQIEREWEKGISNDLNQVERNNKEIKG